MGLFSKFWSGAGTRRPQAEGIGLRNQGFGKFSMNGSTAAAREAQWLKWRSVADLYHAYFTGLILTVVTRRGTADAAEFVFRVFRRQQQERFLPGLEKLGPQPFAAGGGGGAVPLPLQLDRRRPCRIHVRDRPQGLDPLSAAALDLEGHRDLRRARQSVARHAARPGTNNGVALGNLNLGFVCTKQSVDGQDGLEGFYCEYDHPLELDARLRFARHLEAPLFDPATAPALPVARSLSE